MKLNSIEFGQFGTSDVDGQRSFVADYPPIRLTPDKHLIERHAYQRSLLTALDIHIGDDTALFGSSLNWACSAFIVHRTDAKQVTRNVLGSRPPQPIGASQLARIPQGKPSSRNDQVLYLFNVLVALEWTPDARYLAQLEWGFRRASDFLFDVTDGYMAFGQVVFGGREMMDCADIIILASNRLHPRSWVAGMHEATKYTPIRLGRGMWSRRNQTTIGWDEPEGYRTLVHEWGHYALGLRDRYLRVEERVLDNRAMVLPDCGIASSTIMATLEGTSELVPHRGDGGGRESDWTRMRHRFSSLPERPPRLVGPGALPLPLPVFQYIGSLEDSAPAPPTLDRSLFTNDLLKSAADRCWVYVLRHGEAGPEQLLAFGTLDPNIRGDIQLHGAFPGDQLLAVLQSKTGALHQFQGQVNADGTSDITEAKAKSAFVDVLPSVRDSGRGKPDATFVTVRVVSQETPERVWIFPLGGDADPIDAGRPDSREWQSDTLSVPTLDGHVLVRWNDGSMQIGSFSQGGGPNSHTPVGFSPVTAGSSNGNVMIFFRDDDWTDPDQAPRERSKKKANKDYSDVKVITTLLPGVDPRLPGRYANATRGYVYSLAASTALPLELTPTLIMYYDAVRVADDAKPRIYREVDGHWEELACYPSPRCGYVAVPLDATSASKLVDQDVDGPRVERYRLVWA